ncbi:MAG: hypothetical protein JWO62_2823 [Acidimicrobiaceae bacterium]|jgi:hypothetical protein|nr:hypothetical protein [Acidimicrobiaceae bacterium]
MSSHREAPEVSRDPCADSTDVYAFVSPDRTDTVTLIANYIPFENPAGGPNFYEFGDDICYAINVDHTGDGVADVSYQFSFHSELTNPNTFLYNTGPIESLTSSSWNRRQVYDVSRTDASGTTVLAQGLPSPPCNIGPLSTPSYATLASAAINDLPGGAKVFAGQRAEAFFVDLGAIFDLGDLRPIAELHATFGLPALTASPGVNTTAGVNVHTIALQVPISDLTRGGYTGGNVLDPRAVIGVWTTASRRKVVIRSADRSDHEENGPFVQESRLGNPLFNEVLVPLARKDEWNRESPSEDAEFASGVTFPELAKLLPVLYPGAFPNLAAFNSSGMPRADLAAILLTGIPVGVVSSSFQNFTGTTQADMLRLNTAIKPSASPNPFGVVGGDLAGFPNGRRVTDDIVTIELQAIAGATIPLVDKAYVPDAAIADVSDGVTGAGLQLFGVFPYLGTPYSGFDVPS